MATYWSDHVLVETVTVSETPAFPFGGYSRTSQVSQRKVTEEHVKCITKCEHK